MAIPRRPLAGWASARLIPLGAALLLAAGCVSHLGPRTGEPGPGAVSSAPPPPPPPPPPPVAGSAAPGPSAPAPLPNNAVELVRYIGLDRSGWSAHVAPAAISDLYTRLVVESGEDRTGDLNVGPDGRPAAAFGLRDYDRERRPWVARWVSSKAVTITTLAQVDIADPALPVALPLFSISHNSAASGEVFVTSVTSADVRAPLFRIQPNTSVTVHLSTKISNDVRMQAASTALKAVQTAVNIAAPTSTILTTLSAKDVSNAASAIDKALSGIASQDVSEDIDLGRLADTWTPGARIVVNATVPGKLVRGEADVEPGGRRRIAGDKVVARWVIKLSCPRLSYFDARDLCAYDAAGAPAAFDTGAARVRAMKDQIATAASASTILREPLSAQVSVMAFVQTQPWFTDFLQKSTKGAADTRLFCSNAMTSLFNAGLSRFDASLVLWAMGEQMPGIATLEGPAAVSQATCGGLVDPAVRLSAGPDPAASAGPKPRAKSGRSRR